MKKNIGSADRVIRILLAAVIAILYFTNQITGTVAILLGLVAAVLVVTSVVGTCPLFAIFGISTRKRQQ